MRPQDSLVPDLMELGLTTYEARAYAALIRRDSFTATQLAREAGLPRQRVYDVLDRLVRQRLATVVPGQTASFRAVEPAIAMERLVELDRYTFERHEKLAARVAESLAPTWAAGREHTNPLDFVELLRDDRAIIRRYAQVQREAERELLCFAMPPYHGQPVDNLEASRAARRLRRTGGESRTVYTDALFDDAETLAAVLRDAEAGEEVRITDSLPLKLVIADRSLVLCEMPDPVAGTGASTVLVINHPGLAACLWHTFTVFWAMARPLAEVHAERTGR